MTVFLNPPAFSDEPITISDIVADPEVFHLKQVTLQGVVGRVKELEPYYLPSGSACYGAYTFLLEDEQRGRRHVGCGGTRRVWSARMRFPEVAD
jgi:hypothetical protein